MPNSEVAVCHSASSMAVAIKVQGILTNQTDSSVRHHLAFRDDPDMESCGEVFHLRIRERILRPYDWHTGAFVGFFLYSAQNHKTLKLYHARLNHALMVIQEELLPIKNRPDSNYSVQMHVINGCLLKYLNAMALAMPWHQEAAKLFISESKSDIKMLEIDASGEVRIISAEALYLAARDRADQLSFQLQQERAASSAKISALEKEVGELKAMLKPDNEPQNRPFITSRNAKPKPNAQQEIKHQPPPPGDDVALQHNPAMIGSLQ